MTTLHASALLFDLDGTLVNSSGDVEKMWRAWCEKVGVDVADLLAVSEGRQGKSVVAELAPHLDPVAEDDWIIDYQLNQNSTAEPLPGAGDMLRSLGDGSPEKKTAAKWGIVTSCVHDLAMNRLDAAGLPRPPMIVPADQITRSKPDPEGFLVGAERLGVAPAGCIVFEDSTAGLTAAREAGMVGVAITAATRDTPAADHVARDWTEITIAREGDGWTVTV